MRFWLVLLALALPGAARAEWFEASSAHFVVYADDSQRDIRKFSEQLERYLAGYDDEGNGWGRLAEAYAALGRPEDARAALDRGIAASYRFGHPGMAAELEERRDELA